MSLNEATTSALRAPALVGRARELATLHAAWEKAASGEGRVVMLVGEPGIGKTRTAAEFVAATEARGGIVLRGASYEGEWAPAYGPFVEALTAYVRRADATELVEALGVHAAAIARIIPALRERIPTITEPVALQPDEERFRCFDAVAQFLLALSRRHPLLLMLDDLHWADEGTLGLMRHVARFAPQHRFLLLGTYRDVELGGAHPLINLLEHLRRESRYERVRLRGLTLQETTDLIATLTSEKTTDELIDQICTYTDGNPFFIHEVVQHVVEQGVLGPGRRVDLTKLGVPEGVRQVIGRRVARTSAATQRWLTVASVWNGPFPHEIVAAVAELDTAAGLAAIDEALHGQLIRPSAATDRYDFGHALIRHTLYAALSPSRRAWVHRAVADAMAQAYGDGAMRHAAEIAHHYCHSAELPGAEAGAAFCLAAAEQAERGAALEDVAAHLRAALQLMPAADPARVGLLCRLGLALVWALEFEEARRVAADAARCMADTQGREPAADYLAAVATALNDAGAHDYTGHSPLVRQGLDYVGDRRDMTWAVLKALDIIDAEIEDPTSPGIPLDTPQRREVAVVFKAHGETSDTFWGFIPWESRADILARDPSPASQFAVGDYRGGVQLYRRDATECERLGRITRAVELWAYAERFHIALGQFVAAQEIRNTLAALCERLPEPAGAIAQVVAAEDEWRLAMDDEWDSPMRQFGPGVGDGPIYTWYRASTTAAVARTHARMGRVEPAIRRLSALLAAIEGAPGWVQNYPRVVCDAAETLWLTRRTDWIEVIEANLRDKVVVPDFRYPMMDSRLALGRLCALQQCHEEAAEWFASARAVLDEQGARPLRAVVDYDEALMCQRRGAPDDRERARPLLESALAQFRSLGMPGWTRRAEHLLWHWQEWGATRPSVTASVGRSSDVAVERNARAEVPYDDDLAAPAESASVASGEFGRSVIRRDGDMWTISYADRTVQLRDTRGLRYLARLLTDPTREQHATELIGTAAATPVNTRALDDTQVVAVDLGDAGAILDAQATAQYQRRLAELREEIEEAEANNDLGRVPRLRAELSFLTDQLVSAGRGRRTASHAERARVTVTKGILATVKKIVEAHPELGRHLKATIRTGYFCSYTPDPRSGIEWLSLLIGVVLLQA